MAQLWKAIRRGDIELAETLVKSGVNLHERLHWHPKKPSFLHAVITWWANDSRSEKVALEMIERGADVNACDAIGNSVLHVALTHNCSVALIRELLNKGAKVDAINSNGLGIFMLAICQPTALQLLPMLIEGDFVDVSRREDRGLKVLYYLIASDRNNLAEMEAVLKLGLPINRLSEKGYTLLHYAVLLEKIDKVQLLLQYGADVHVKSIDNTYSLFVALSQKTFTIAILLIEKGANIHECNDDGLYPIHVACRSRSFQNIQLLLRLGVDVNVVDKKGRTAFSLLHSMDQKCRILLVKHLALLVAQGIAVHENDLNIIRTTDLQTFFDEYSRELQKSKQIKIYNDISFFFILTKSIKELSMLMKNEDFIKNYENYSDKMSALIPTYHAYAEFKFKVAERRRDILLSQLSILEQMFDKILPSLMLEKIAYYLCHDQLSSLIQDYIFSATLNCLS